VVRQLLSTGPHTYSKHLVLPLPILVWGNGTSRAAARGATRRVMGRAWGGAPPEQAAGASFPSRFVEPRLTHLRAWARVDTLILRQRPALVGVSASALECSQAMAAVGAPGVSVV
jgi:hypothetical protein